MADTRLRAVTVNLSCGQPESRLFNVQWPVGGRAGRRARRPPRRAAKAARARRPRAARPSTRCRWPSRSTTRRAWPIRAGCIATTLTARLHVIDAAHTALRIAGRLHGALRPGYRRTRLGADGRGPGHAWSTTSANWARPSSTWAAAPPAWRCSPKASCCTPRSCRSAACTSPTISRACCPRRSPTPSG